MNQKKLAEILHVSPSTVSKALSGSNEISQEIKDAVQKLAIDMGYFKEKSRRKRDYNKNSALATTYKFNFEGTVLNLNIRFDPEVLAGSIPLDEAWNEGYWSIAITSESAGNFLDIKNSNSFTNSLGSMIDTFRNIYFFDVPNVDSPLWSMLLWLFCVLPAEVALMLFLKSVFGMAGVGAGILANALAFVL